MNPQLTTSLYQLRTKHHEYKRSGSEREFYNARNENVSKTKISSCSNWETIQTDPDVIYGSTDNRNALAVMTGIEDSNCFNLANKNDTLRQLYTDKYRKILLKKCD